MGEGTISLHLDVKSSLWETTTSPTTRYTRILKQHRDGYIDDVELQSEMAAVELALRGLEVPEMNGLRLDDIVAAIVRLPGIAALWEVATPEERRDMVLLMLEPGACTMIWN